MHDTTRFCAPLVYRTVPSCREGIALYIVLSSVCVPSPKAGLAGWLLDVGVYIAYCVRAKSSLWLPRRS